MSLQRAPWGSLDRGQVITLALIVAAGLFAAANIWTGTNTFQNLTTFSGAVNLTNKTVTTGFNTTLATTHTKITHLELPNPQINVTTTGRLVSLPTNATGTACLRNQTGVCGQISINGLIRTTVSGVANTTSGATNVFASINKFLTKTDLFFQDISDATKQLSFDLSSITTANTITDKWPNFNGTVGYVGAFNSTVGQLSGNGTGTASTNVVMDGVYATLTPHSSDNATVAVYGSAASGTTGDGCRIDVRAGTSNLGANGAAKAGTVLGVPIKTTTAVGGDPVPFAFDITQTGLTGGTKEFYDLGIAAVTGGTCTLTSVYWNINEN